MHGPLERDHLAREVVDAAGEHLVVVLAEQLVLDLVDVVLEPQHDRLVLVDHLVDDRVEHGLRAERQQFRGLLHPRAHVRQVGRLRVPHRHHEVLADEHVQLAELHHLLRVEVAGRPQHHEEGVVVAFELRALVALAGVLHRQVVQPELGGHRIQLRVGRPVEADPRHALLVAGDLEGLVERLGRAHAPAVAIDGVVDERHAAIMLANRREAGEARPAPARTGELSLRRPGRGEQQCPRLRRSPRSARRRSRRSATTSRSCGETVRGRPLVYLDSAATAQKPLAVLDAERDYLLRPQRRRAPRRTHPRGRGHLRVRGGPRDRRRASSASTPTNWSGPRTPPRASTSSPTPSRTPPPRPATTACASAPATRSW